MLVPVLGSLVTNWCPCTWPELVTTWILPPAPAPAPTDKETDSSSSALMFTLGVLLYSDSINKDKQYIKHFFNMHAK